MRLCCFAAEPSRNSDVETDYGDLLVSNNIHAETKQPEAMHQQVQSPVGLEAVEAQIVLQDEEQLQPDSITTGNGAKLDSTLSNNGPEMAAGTEVSTSDAVQDTIRGNLAGVIEHASRQLTGSEEQTPDPPLAGSIEVYAASVEQQKPGEVKSTDSSAAQEPQAASDAEDSLLLPSIKYLVHTMSDGQKLAVDQLVNSVCHALGEVGVRSVQGEYKTEEAVPPSNAVLGPLRSLDIPTFLRHAQQLPAQLLMVLLVLKGQKTNATKQQPVSLSLRKARRIKAAAERYLGSINSNETKQTPPTAGQSAIDTDRFQKLLQEADPSVCNVLDSIVSQNSRAKYTGHDAVLTIDAAAELLATATAATRERFSSRFSEAAAGNQSSIAFADMKKCLPAIHRLCQQDDSIIRALLRSEISEMSLAKGVPLLKRFATEYMENPKYAANLELPVVLRKKPEASSPSVVADYRAA